MTAGLRKTHYFAESVFCRAVLTLEALRRGGMLIVPLMLVSVAVASIGVERLRFWWQWSRGDLLSPELLLPELDQLNPSEASLRQHLLLARLERKLCRWDGALELCMVLGPLLGLLATVIGLMQLLQALGPGLTLPSQGNELVAGYGQVLIGTVLGLLIAVLALLVQRLNRLRAQVVLNAVSDRCLERRSGLI